jgi:hypothetical protein
LFTLRERHPSIVDTVYLETSSKVDIPSDLVIKPRSGGAFVEIYSADIASRIEGIKDLFANLLKSKHGDMGEYDRWAAKEAISARLGEQEPAIVEAIYDNAEIVTMILDKEEFITAVRPAFVADKPDQAVLNKHLTYIFDTILGGKPEMAGKVFEELLFPVLLPTEGRRTLGQAEWTIISSAPASRFDLLKKVGAAVGKLVDPLTENGLSKEESVRLYQNLIRSLSGTSVDAEDATDELRRNHHFRQLRSDHRLRLFSARIHPPISPPSRVPSARSIGASAQGRRSAQTRHPSAVPRGSTSARFSDQGR